MITLGLEITSPLASVCKADSSSCNTALPILPTKNCIAPAGLFAGKSTNKFSVVPPAVVNIGPAPPGETFPGKPPAPKTMLSGLTSTPDNPNLTPRSRVKSSLAITIRDSIIT